MSRGIWCQHRDSHPESCEKSGNKGFVVSAYYLTLTRVVINIMRIVLCGSRYHDSMLSILYAIGPMHALSNQR